MAFTSRNNIGIDVMKVRIPGNESFASFVDTVGDQVGSFPYLSPVLTRIPRS